MKYWSDDCDIYSAKNIDELFEDLSTTYGEVDKSMWERVSAWKLVWIIDLHKAREYDRNKSIKSFFIKILWKRPLWWIDLFYSVPSLTGKTRFLCSTEW